jgi:hypothetical protein
MTKKIKGDLRHENQTKDQDPKPKPKPRGKAKVKKVCTPRPPEEQVKHVFNNNAVKQAHLEELCKIAELSYRLWQVALRKAIPKLISAASSSYKQTLDNIQMIDPHRAQAIAQKFMFLDFGDESANDLVNELPTMGDLN